MCMCHSVVFFEDPTIKDYHENHQTFLQTKNRKGGLEYGFLLNTAAKSAQKRDLRFL